MGLEAQCARLVASCGKKTDRKQGWTSTLTVSFFYTDDWWHIFYQPQKICSKDVAVEVWLGCFALQSDTHVKAVGCLATWVWHRLWLPPPAEEEVILHRDELLSIETPPRIIWSDLCLWITCSALWLKMSECSSSLKWRVFKAAEVISPFHLEHLFKVLFTAASQKLHVHSFSLSSSLARVSGYADIANDRTCWFLPFATNSH